MRTARFSTISRSIPCIGGWYTHLPGQTHLQGSGVSSHPQWTDRYLCKHYLPATSFVGGNNTKEKNIFTEVLNSPRASEISFVVTTTAIGCPLPSGLPQVTMSGITSVEKNIIVQARMLQPLPATKKQA